MSRSLSYIFPAGNNSDVCLTQTLAGAGNLNLNGNLANKLNGQVSFIQNGYSRQISITSANNLAGRQFTIVGMQNGVAITETIIGPGVLSPNVYSTQIYDVINSISVNGAAGNVSVGTAGKGFFPLIGINTEKDVINYTLTLGSITGDDITIGIYGTLDNLANNRLTLLQNLPVGQNKNVFELKTGALTQYVYSNFFTSPTNPSYIYSQLIVYIGNASDAINLSTKLNFIQT